jgi:hypothetical protein
MLVPQLAHGRGDDEADRVADGDPAGLGGRPGARGGLGGCPQQRLGLRQEDLAGLGEPAALRGAVQQPGAQLLFEVPDLPAQGRLGNAESFGGAAEVPIGSQRPVAGIR